MKKIFRLIAALAAATVAFSCMEEANPETPAADTENNGGTHYEGPMVTLTFSVDELTKTSYDKENGHQWSEGDQIKIIYGTEDDAYTVAEIIDGTVTANVGDVETYYAVYPETTKYTLKEVEVEGNTSIQFAVTIPDGQNGSFKQANIMAAKTSRTNCIFEFKNLTHVFKFYRSEDSEFNGFRFLTNSSSGILLRGTYPVEINEDGSVEMGEPTGQSRYIACTGLQGTGPFYIGFGPGVNMDHGFAVMGTRSTKNTDWEETALTTGKVETTRGTITNLNIELDKVLHNDWYIKETAEGKGDGTSWDNAGDIHTLLKLIGNELADGVPYNENTNCLRLNNARIYIAEGEYDIPTAVGADYLAWGDKWGYDKKAPEHKTTILGGYPATATGKDITTRDIDAYPTKLVNPYKTQNNRVLHFNAVTIPDLTFDGITFTKSSTGSTIDTGRGRIMLATKAKGKITFSNCRFTGLATSNNIGGSAIDIRQASTSEVVFNFENCSFTDNQQTNASTYGGVIVVEPDTENATINIADCVFKSNSSTVSGSDKQAVGGAIFAAAGVMNISGTTFDSNSSQHLGGAIYADRNAEINISGNCTFKSNTAHLGGSVYADNCSISIQKTAFNSNSCTDRGGAVYLTNGAEVAISNACTFNGNSTTNYGGAVYIDGPTAKATITASEFTSNTTKNGGAIANYGSIMIVDNCSFQKNVGTNQGGAIVSFDASLTSYTASGNQCYSYIYNSSFNQNYVQYADGKESGNQGGTIKAHGSGYIAIVNSTFTGSNGKVGTIRLRHGAEGTEGVKCWIISSTIANDRSGFWNQGSEAKLYNTINHKNTTNGGTGGTFTNDFTKTIFNSQNYQTTSSSTPLTDTDILGAFANGVFPVTASSADATNGMSSEDLAALGAEGSPLRTAMPLFDVIKLTVDQKGNPRVGKTVMGAFVGE